MVAKRDPRIDPRPGDVLRLRTGTERTVTGGHWYTCPDGTRVQTFVYYRKNDGTEHSTNRFAWAKWARAATVVHVVPAESPVLS